MSYEAEWRARFGEGMEPAPDQPDQPWLRQVLTRRTHRRYAERPVPEALLRLLLGTAFSASSKSDFQ
jgi:FMN reductase [NAD(P)H]